jgi:hypothetical protein
MDKQPIELRKERDLGQVINATFTFIAQEIKTLARMLGIIIVPAFLLVSILSIYVQYRTNNATYVDHDVSIFLTSGYWFTMLLLMLVQLVTHTLLMASVYSYMKLYLQKGSGNFTFSDLLEEVRIWFWNIMGSNILVAIIIVFGLILLIIPGFYLMVPLSFLPAIMVFEEKSFSNSYSRCFHLIRNNWWWTFLLMLVLFMIIGSIAMFIAMPFMILGFLKAFHTSSSPLEIQASYLGSTMSLVGTAIQTVITYLSYFIFYVAYSFQYFNLLEQKDKPSLLEKVDQLGN